MAGVVIIKKYLPLFIIFISLLTSCSSTEILSGLLSDNTFMSQNQESDMTTANSTNPATLTFDCWEYEIIDEYVRINKCWDFGPSIIIPDKIEGKAVKVIGEDAFYQHKATLSITIPESVTTIEGGAFYRCYALEEIFIPKTVTEVEGDAFFRCSSLKNIFVDSENEKFADINGVLFCKDISVMIKYPEGKQEESYFVPESVTKVDDSAFGYNCEALKTLIISESVTEMPSNSLFAFPKKLIIKVKAGSVADEYAKKYAQELEQLGDNIEGEIIIHYY